MQGVFAALSMFVLLVAAGGVYVKQRRGHRHASRHTADRLALGHDAFGAAHYPVEQAVLASEIRKVLAKTYRRDLSRIVPTDRLKEDLHLYAPDDPMPVHDLLMHMEDAFHIHIPDEDVAGIVTFNDVVQCVAKRKVRA